MLTPVGPIDYENIDGTLAKLHQGSGSVQNYQTHLEQLANRVHGLPDCALMGTFVQGLRDEMGQEDLMFQPATLQEAMGLARLQEEKLNKLRKWSRPTTVRPAI